MARPIIGSHFVKNHLQGFLALCGVTNYDTACQRLWIELKPFHKVSVKFFYPTGKGGAWELRNTAHGDLSSVVWQRLQKKFPGQFLDSVKTTIRIQAVDAVAIHQETLLLVNDNTKEERLP